MGESKGSERACCTSFFSFSFFILSFVSLASLVSRVACMAWRGVWCGRGFFLLKTYVCTEYTYTYSIPIFSPFLFLPSRYNPIHIDCLLILPSSLYHHPIHRLPERKEETPPPPPPHFSSLCPAPIPAIGRA